MIDLGLVGVVVGGVAVLGLFVLFVLREVRLAHRRGVARERMRRRCVARWSSGAARPPVRGDGPLVQSSLGSRVGASEGEGSTG